MMRLLVYSRQKLKTLYKKWIISSSSFTSSTVTTSPTHSKSERQGFGSFHSEDIEVLIRQNDDEYKVPEVYQMMSEQSAKRLVSSLQLDPLCGDKYLDFFGRRARKQLFVIYDDWTFINHGAFGASLEPLLYESSVWRYMCDAQPLKFFDRDLLPMVAHTIRCISKHLNCPADELLPLPNVTTGLNAIFNSVEMKGRQSLGPGDEIVCFSLTYGSTKKMLSDLAARTGASLKIIELSLPIASPTSVIQTLEKEFSPGTKLVVIDHITSNTAMELPIIKMAAACKRISNGNATVVIDAAHSLFSNEGFSIYPSSSNNNNNGNDKDSNGKSVEKESPESISEVADYWLTNAHKWLCNPKGAAFMWVSPNVKSCTRPAIISHGFAPASTQNFVNNQLFPPPNKLLSSFSWDGCRDYASLLTVPSALSTWEFIDDMASGLSVPTSRTYMRNLLHNAVKLLSEEWKISNQDFAAPFDMRENSPMALVPLPRKFRGVHTRSGKNTDKEAFQLQEWLHHNHLIEVPVKCQQGKLYLRLSAHVHNSMEDYEKLVQVFRNEA